MSISSLAALHFKIVNILENRHGIPYALPASVKISYMRILIIEDEIKLAQALQESLAALHYSVVLASADHFYASQEDAMLQAVKNFLDDLE